MNWAWSLTVLALISQKAIMALAHGLVPEAHGAASSVMTVVFARVQVTVVSGKACRAAARRST